MLVEAGGPPRSPADTVPAQQPRDLMTTGSLGALPHRSRRGPRSAAGAPVAPASPGPSLDGFSDLDSCASALARRVGVPGKGPGPRHTGPGAVADAPPLNVPGVRVRVRKIKRMPRRALAEGGGPGEAASPDGAAGHPRRTDDVAGLVTVQLRTVAMPPFPGDPDFSIARQTLRYEVPVTVHGRPAASFKLSKTLPALASVTAGAALPAALKLAGAPAKLPPSLDVEFSPATAVAVLPVLPALHAAATARLEALQPPLQYVVLLVHTASCLVGWAWFAADLVRLAATGPQAKMAGAENTQLPREIRLQPAPAGVATELGFDSVSQTKLCAVAARFSWRDSLPLLARPSLPVGSPVTSPSPASRSKCPAARDLHASAVGPGLCVPGPGPMAVKLDSAFTRPDTTSTRPGTAESCSSRKKAGKSGTARSAANARLLQPCGSVPTASGPITLSRRSHVLPLSYSQGFMRGRVDQADEAAEADCPPASAATDFCATCQRALFLQFGRENGTGAQARENGLKEGEDAFYIRDGGPLARSTPLIGAPNHSTRDARSKDPQPPKGANAGRMSFAAAPSSCFAPGAPQSVCPSSTGTLGQSNVPLGQPNVPLGQSNGPLGQSNVPLGQSNISLGQSSVTRSAAAADCGEPADTLPIENEPHLSGPGRGCHNFGPPMCAASGPLPVARAASNARKPLYPLGSALETTFAAPMTSPLPGTTVGAGGFRVAPCKGALRHASALGGDGVSRTETSSVNSESLPNASSGPPYRAERLSQPLAPRAALSAAAGPPAAALHATGPAPGAAVSASAAVLTLPTAEFGRRHVKVDQPRGTDRSKMEPGADADLAHVVEVFLLAMDVDEAAAAAAGSGGGGGGAFGDAAATRVTVELRSEEGCHVLKGGSADLVARWLGAGNLRGNSRRIDQMLKVPLYKSALRSVNMVNAGAVSVALRCEYNGLPFENVPATLQELVMDCGVGTDVTLCPLLSTHLRPSHALPDVPDAELVLWYQVGVANGSQ